MGWSNPFEPPAALIDEVCSLIPLNPLFIVLCEGSTASNQLETLGFLWGILSSGKSGTYLVNFTHEGV